MDDRIVHLYAWKINCVCLRSFRKQTDYLIFPRVNFDRCMQIMDKNEVAYQRKKERTRELRYKKALCFGSHLVARDLRPALAGLDLPLRVTKIFQLKELRTLLSIKKPFVLALTYFHTELPRHYRQR